MKELIEDLRALGGLCHVTNVRNYRKIRDSGFIKPNDGTFPLNWGQYSCSELGAVSLFDFRTPDLATLFDGFTEGKWNPVVTKHWPTAVVIVVDRNRLPVAPLSYEEIKKRGCSGNLIPHGIEVCYPGEIELQYIKAQVLALVYNRRVHDYELVDQNLLSDASLRQIQKKHGVAAEKMIRKSISTSDCERELLLEKVYREEILKESPLSEKHWERRRKIIKRQRLRKELRDLKRALKW